MTTPNPVEIWFLDYKKLSQLSHDWKSVLSEEEKQRADRFYFENDKDRFIIYHACKRIILSNYLKQKPREIIIFLQKNGKPFLKNTPLHFNLSHTKEMAILAVSKDVEIGIDIEKINPSTDYLGIAKRFFHVREYQQLLKTKDAQMQQQQFFVLWTAKEAILKATGEGITAGLDNFSVHYDCAHPNLLTHTHANNIALVSLKALYNHVATLAITQKVKPVVYRELSI